MAIKTETDMVGMNPTISTIINVNGLTTLIKRLLECIKKPQNLTVCCL